MVALMGLIVFVSFMPKNASADTEVTLAFGWRVSGQGLVIGEPIYPYVERYSDDHWVYENTHSLVRPAPSLERRGYLALGLDWRLYKGWTLGFEINAGFISEEAQVTNSYYPNAGSTETYESEEAEFSWPYKVTIVPINVLLLTKYKFEAVRKATGFIRPYIGAGGGIGASLTFYDGGISVMHCGKVAGVFGVDIFFGSKTATAIFVEAGYVKDIQMNEYLSPHYNGGERWEIKTGFRF